MLVSEIAKKEVYATPLSVGIAASHPQRENVACYFWDGEEFDHVDHVYVYKDGSVLWEHIEHYPEFWVQWVQPYGGLADSYSGESCKAIDSLDYAANNLSFVEAYKTIFDYYEDSGNRLSCKLPQLTFYMRCSEYIPQMTGVPGLGINLLLSRPTDIRKTPGYKLWIQGQVGNVFLYKKPFDLEIHYPVNFGRQKKIQVIYFVQGKRHCLDWIHGQKGLFWKIFTDFWSKVKSSFFAASSSA